MADTYFCFHAATTILPKKHKDSYYTVGAVVNHVAVVYYTDAVVNGTVGAVTLREGVWMNI